MHIVFERSTTKGRNTVIEPDSGATNLFAAMQRCQDTGDRDGIYICAEWLEKCGDLAANEALGELAREHGLQNLTIDEALRQLAQHCSNDLAHWCLHASGQLDLSTPPEPSTWLPTLINALSADDYPLPTALRRVALADMSLLTCSNTVLTRNAAHIHPYQAVRASILARAAEQN